MTDEGIPGFKIKIQKILRWAAKHSKPSDNTANVINTVKVIEDEILGNINYIAVLAELKLVKTYKRSVTVTIP